MLCKEKAHHLPLDSYPHTHTGLGHYGSGFLDTKENKFCFIFSCLNFYKCDKVTNFINQNDKQLKTNSKDKQVQIYLHIIQQK